jgi:hypothetical protein
MPLILTPSTLFTIIAGYPVVDTRVAIPIPKITVFAFLTTIEPVKL